MKNKSTKIFPAGAFHHAGVLFLLAANIALAKSPADFVNPTPNKAFGAAGADHPPKI